MQYRMLLNVKTILFVVVMALFLSPVQAIAGVEGDEFDSSDRPIVVYPNPAVEYLMIDVSAMEMQLPVFQLYNVIGSIVTVNVEKLEDGQYKAQIKDIPCGVYWLIIKDSNAQIKQAYRFLKN